MSTVGLFLLETTRNIIAAWRNGTETLLTGRIFDRLILFRRPFDDSSPTFPSTCLAPDQPGYGQVLDNAGRRRKRGPNAAARAAAAALRNQQHLNSQVPPRGQYGDYRHHYPSQGYYGYPGAPPEEYGNYPPRPPSPYGYDNAPGPYGPGYPIPPPNDAYGYPPPSALPGQAPSGRSYPPGPPPTDYSFPPRNDAGPSGAPSGFSRRGPSDSRTRYTPYPVPISPTQPHSYPPPPSAGGYYGNSSNAGGSGSGGPLDLPPISAIALGPSVQRDGPGSSGAGRPMLERSLPPIESMSREGAGMPPSMDTAAVLRRLRLEDSSTNSSGGEMSPQTEAPPRSALTPLGIARRESGGPSEQYLQTRRRSASAPPPIGILGSSFSSLNRRDYERDPREFDRRGNMAPPPGEYAHTVGPGGSPDRYKHSYSRSGSEHYPNPSGSAGPSRNAYHHHDRHHPYAQPPSTSRPSSSSSMWTKQNSPSFDREAPINRADSPVSPASSAPPFNPHVLSMHAHYAQSRSPPHSPPNSYALHPRDTSQKLPSARGPFVGISHHASNTNHPIAPYDERDEMDEDEDTSDSRAPHSSSFVRGEGHQSPAMRRASDQEVASDVPRRSSTASMRHRNSNTSSHRGGDIGGGGLEALARAAASASASQASMSPPHKSDSPVETINRSRPSDMTERSTHTDRAPVRAPVRPWEP